VEQCLNKCSRVCLDRKHHLALVVLLLLDLLHVGRHEGLARFQLVEPGSDPFRCFHGRGIRDLLEAPDVEPAGLYAGEGPLVGLIPLFIANASLQAGDAGRGILRRLLSLRRSHSTPRVSPIRPRFRSPRCQSGLDTTVSQPDT